MPNPPAQQLLAQMAGMPSGIVHVPSQAEKDEVHRVQGLQVRTNAANLATNLLAEEEFSAPRWTAAAKVIEDYIWGELAWERRLSP